MFARTLVALVLSATALGAPAAMSFPDILGRSVVDCADPTKNAIITEASVFTL